jgi:hypothetical protein
VSGITFRVFWRAHALRSKSDEPFRKDFKKKAVGAPGSRSKEEQDKTNRINNPIHNPINNPIRNKKRKGENDLENRKTIVSQGLKHIMRSKTETEELCEYLLHDKTYPVHGDLTMSHAARSGPRFGPPWFLLLAGYENLTAPNAIMQS